MLENRSGAKANQVLEVMLGGRGGILARDTSKAQSRDYTSKPPDAGARFADRRSVPRYSLIAAVEVFEPVSRTSCQGRTTEIAMNGCYVDMIAPLPANTVFQLRIRRESGAFESWGRVAYSQKGLGMGVAFLKTRPDQEDILKKWLAELSPR